MSAAWSAAAWALLGATALALWAVSRRAPDAVAPPAAVVRRLATGPVARLALGLCWAWVGWHLFAR